jgi:hypothetical protein
VAQTYTWGDLVTVGSAMGKGLPLTKVTPQICDFVSQDMYIEYPWKNTITNTAKGDIPLLDSVQDYTCSAPNIMRALKASLVRTDVTPHQHRDITVSNDLSVDLVPRSWYAINLVSLQQALGLFRLQSAVNVPIGARLELRVDYQINPAKVTGLSNPLWFDDRYSAVAFEGLLYWIYKLADDSRAGAAEINSDSMVPVYTGQLGIYKGALSRMKAAENFGATDFVFPYEPMGTGRDQNSLQIFGS